MSNDVNCLIPIPVKCKNNNKTQECYSFMKGKRFLFDKSIRKLIKLRFNYTKWVWLGTINTLIALGWLFSLIHYTPAIELGGRELFAFHLAISLHAINNIQSMVNNYHD